MIEGPTKQILLIAPDLLGETLSIQLNSQEPNLDICLKKDQISNYPSLVVWAIENIELSSTTLIEIKKIKEKWRPAPLLLLLPARVNLKPSQILQFDSEGIIQDPDIQLLRETIDTLLTGGRVVRLNESVQDSKPTTKSLFNLGTWFLNKSIVQINAELDKLDHLLNIRQNNLLSLLLIKGRRREIKSARSFLIWLWSPIHVSLIMNESTTVQNKKYYSTEITISEKSSKAVLDEIYDRIQNAIHIGTRNKSPENNIFAFQALHNHKQKQLFLILLNQFKDVFYKLQSNGYNGKDPLEIWDSLEKELRENTIRELSVNYSRVIKDGIMTPTSDHILSIIDLSEQDDELPLPSIILDTLILDKLILVDGNLIPSNDPRALIKIEELVMNWIIRTGEIISAELINTCSEWPELREYFLQPSLLSTRELERLRNQLNSQGRWKFLVKRPIQLYESKREILKFSQGHIESILINESRDQDLKKLGWWQKQVTLLIEARDALAPQVQSVIKYLGDLMVILLTNVLGRAIGLVGKGIAQGMGRTISR